MAFFTPGTGARYLTPEQRYWADKRAKWDAPLGGGGENPHLDPMNWSGQGLYRNYADLAAGTQWKADQLGKAWKERQTMLAGGPAAEAAAEEAKFPKLRTTVEQPEVADYAKAGLKAAPGQMDKTMTAFEQLLAQQQKETASLRESAPVAYDTSGTEAELGGANQRFEESSGDVLGRLEKNMADYEARQNEIQGQKGAELGVYEGRAQDVADLALAHGTRQQKGAMASAGGNQGWSGAQTNRAARLYRDINVPLQRELSLRRTGLLGEAGSLEREYLGNENAVLSLNQSLNEAFRGNTVATAQYIQNLRSQMRNMSAAEQDNLLRREAETLGLGQKLRSGEITTAGLLAALERSATNYSYTQPFDPSRTAGADGYSPAPLPGVNTGGGGGVRNYTGTGGGAEPAQKTWHQMTPDEQRAYLNQRQLAQVNAGRQYWYGPGQGLNTLGDIPKTLPGGAGIGPGTAPTARDWDAFTTA